MRTMTISVTTLALLWGARLAAAATIVASTANHAGTAADPWPGSAIQSAIASAKGGDVVLVKTGYWSISTPLSSSISNFTLQGESIDARLVYKDGGSWTLAKASGYVSNVKVTGLTFDAALLTTGTAVSIQNCVGCTFSANRVITGSANSQALFFLGGANVTIASNNIYVGPSNGGGTQLQINSYEVASPPIALNTGYDIYGNLFDATALFIIGMSDIRIHENRLINTKGQGQSIAFAAAYTGHARNLVISNNTLDLSNTNFATITGIPEDPNGQGDYDGIVITGNVIKATRASIAISTYDDACLNTCTEITKSHNVTITNNILQSAWIGSEISIAGGLSGIVENAVVQGNILIGPAGSHNLVKSDSKTTNANVANNSFLPP
jgi:hypothetical protein